MHTFLNIKQNVLSSKENILMCNIAFKFVGEVKIGQQKNPVTLYLKGCA